jgi:hypothetical protein
MKSKTEKDPKEERKSYPLRLNKATLKALKHLALETDTSVQKIIEELIESHLKQGVTKE